MIEYHFIDKEDQKSDAKNKNQVLISETKKVQLPTSDDAKGSMKSALKKVAEPAAIEPAEKEVPKEPPAEKLSESSPQEVPESLSEEAKSPSERSIDIHKTLSEKKLIPPRRQVAEMIDRLQEIEGTKSESPLKQIDLDRSGTNQTKRGIHVDGTGDKRNEKKRKAKQARVMIADQDDEKMAASDSINSGKVMEYNSESEISTMSYKDSEVSMAQKQTEDDENETEKYTKDTKVSDKSKCNVKTVEQSQETDSTPQPQAETQTNLAEVIGPNNRLKRTYVFRKKNKVEPAELTHTDINVQTSNLTDTSASVPATETEVMVSQAN
ncbi:hypothetical protein WN48_10776 [Eufriesea mexicana]|uniref:Uncharacterized protein n=1 Tax=Eufriesea mexicana TaxID=516756 RepID=A0A310SDT3_9HYME|nr:hypothetical protein WN48_10776 [Eufriesea mexicana]